MSKCNHPRVVPGYKSMMSLKGKRGSLVQYYYCSTCKEERGFETLNALTAKEYNLKNKK